MLREGQTHTVTVEGFSSEAHGVARIDGQAVFVKGALPGEKCEILIEHIGHNAVWTRVTELLEPHPARQKPPCPHYGRCGGCHTQHMDYKMELRFKSDKITQALRRIGGLDVPPVRVHGDLHPYGYRNKVQFPVGPDSQIGFFQQRTHTVIDVERCLLHDSRVNDIRAAVKGWMADFSVPPYDERTHTGLVRHLYVRQNGDRGMLCVVVVNGDSLPHERELVERIRKTRHVTVEGILLNVNTRRTNVVLGPKNRLLWGAEYLEDTLCQCTFRLSPHSFYQVNRSQAQGLYYRVADFAALTGAETVLDLYCGAGTIGLTLARQARQIIGVETVPQAIQDAKVNAWRNKIENARFLCADAAQAAEQLRGEGLRPDVVIVDPPRKGLAPEVAEILLRMAPARIIYVSCDPATLARDLKTLCQDYALTQVEGYDLFPRTHHVETVCRLEKSKI